MGHLALDLLLNAPLTRGELLVAEFPGLLVDVALVQVGGERDMGQKSENGTGGCPGRRSRGYPASDLGVLSQISGDTPKPAQSRQK